MVATPQPTTTMSAHPPRPLHLLTGSPTSTPTTDAFPSPTPPSSFRHPKRASMVAPSTCSSPTSSSRVTKASRRQSSIGYFPPDLKEYSRRGSLIRRNSIGALNEGFVSAGGRTEPWAKPRDRPSTASSPVSSIQEAHPPGMSLRERPPLTLTEKHADLLRFIAQKESKCLELRSQLAMHEAELAELKRKWQRIVNRGLEREPHTAPLNGSIDAGSVVLDGLREGVQEVSRILTAGFLASNGSSNTPSGPSGHSPKSNPHRPSLMRKAHSAKESDSSISTNMTFRSGNTTGRFSQSSISSFGEDVSGSPGEEEAASLRAEKEGGNTDSNVQVLMVRDTGATPTMSPNPEFHQQRQKQKQRAQAQCLSPSHSPTRTGANGSGLPAPTNLAGESDGQTWASNIQSTTTRVHRRKSREIGRLDFEHLDFSSLSPSVLLSPPSMSRSNTTSPGGSPSLPPLDASDTTMRKSGGIDLKSNSGSNLPGLAPISSIPGLGSMAAGVASPPMASWMDSMGKKFGQLQRSSTFTKNQKRASLILSDMSSSIVSVLAPASTPSAGTKIGADVRNGRKPSSLVVPPASPNPSSLGSLLDDEDENETAKLGSAVLQPVTTFSSAPPMKQVETGNAKEEDFDDEEWNW